MSDRGEAPGPSPGTVIAPAQLLALLAVALGLRLLLALSAPLTGGDTAVYLTVAENIFDNLCVSRAPPEAAACTPHWGGNQLPGYPAFIAASWWLLGKSESSVLISQCVLASLAILRLALAVARYTGSSRVGLVAGVVLAISPADAAWSRALLTEGLIVTLAIWLYAELVLSLHAGRLRVIPLAVCLVLAVFTRIDAVFLSIAVAVCGFALHRPGEALKRGAVIAVLVSLPLAAWAGRSAAAGLGWVPQRLATSSGERMYHGYYDWTRTWMRNQFEAGDALYSASTGNFAAIRIPDSIYLDETERQTVAGLLQALRESGGRGVPVAVDDAFQELADRRRAERPLSVHLLVPLQRAFWMWFTPFSSSGWPLEIERHGAEASQGMLALALHNFDKVAGKLVVNGYRVGLLLLALVLLLRGLSRVRPDQPADLVVLGAALSEASVRTAVLAYLIAAETRYLTASLPGLEIGVLLALFAEPRLRRLLAGSRRTAR